MAFLGPESIDAAEAWYCAVDQGKGEEYSKLLYQRQGAENGGTFVRPNLKAFAGELKLDTASFGACLDSDKYRSKVLAEKQAGQNANIQQTPTVTIDGKIFKNLFLQDQLDAEIQAAIKRHGL
jgi:protein-disulfide isomerase